MSEEWTCSTKGNTRYLITSSSSMPNEVFIIEICNKTDRGNTGFKFYTYYNDKGFRLKNVVSRVYDNEYGVLDTYFFAHKQTYPNIINNVKNVEITNPAFLGNKKYLLQSNSDGSKTLIEIEPSKTENVATKSKRVTLKSKWVTPKSRITTKSKIQIPPLHTGGKNKRRKSRRNKSRRRK